MGDFFQFFPSEEEGVVPASVPCDMLHKEYDDTEEREKEREIISPEQSSFCRPVSPVPAGRAITPALSRAHEVTLILQKNGQDMFRF